MNILTILPSDQFVTAAFAELLTDVQSLLTAADGREERAFWQRQLTALNKAEHHHGAGVRMITRETSYLLPSSNDLSKPVYRLFRAGGVLICDCKAGQKGTLCWHHQYACVVERAAELESLEHKAAETISGGGNDPTPAARPIAHGKEAAAWVAGQQLLRARLEATAQYLDTLRASQEPAPEPKRPLRVRLVEARRKSAYFASAFYLAA